MLQSDANLRKKVQEMGDSIEQIENYSPLAEEMVKQSTISFIEKSAPKFAFIFLYKWWLLFETSEENPLWISDEPLVLSNEKTFGAYGNLGLLSPGIELYLPLCPTLVLEMLCKSHYVLDDKKRTEYEKIRRETPWMIDREVAAHEDKGYAEISGQRPRKLEQENVVRLNSMRLGYSNMLLFSKFNDFELALKILEKGDFKYAELKFS